LKCRTLIEMPSREWRFPMKFHILTIFPDFFRSPFDHGVIQKACEAGHIEIRIHDLRFWTHDRHRTVDDRPFGGGEGMLLKAGPLFEAVESIWPDRDPPVTQHAAQIPGLTAGAGCERRDGSEPAFSPARKGGVELTDGLRPERHAGTRDPARRVVLLSAQGRKFDQRLAREFAQARELLLICGRYEGVDERVAEHLADEEICVGDFVLSGGELAAAMVVDVVARLKEGVLGNKDSAAFESFGEEGLLDSPAYTRPAEFRAWRVPDALLSGNHEEIRKWRRQAAREKTARLRPDLWEARKT
jgi:tRNA (guanine37-N1)-methyltransferase